MPKRIRTFIAVEIEPAVRQALTELQDDLRGVADDVKWVEPENLHLTLKFLGDVDETDLYSVCKMAESSVAGIAAFSMQLAGVGAFPSSNKPKIIWAGIRQGADELVQIHKRLESAFAEEGYPREDRAFTPHLTLGRTRQPRAMPMLAQTIERLADWDGGTSQADEIVIMSSQLGPDGPTYTPMGRTRLL
jgi:2'-5' RNA ligase